MREWFVVDGDLELRRWWFSWVWVPERIGSSQVPICNGAADCAIAPVERPHRSSANRYGW
jgi:hypothetical protein